MDALVREGSFVAAALVFEIDLNVVQGQLKVLEFELESAWMWKTKPFDL